MTFQPPSLHHLSNAELIDLLLLSRYDPHTGYLTSHAALLFHNDIAAGETCIFVDMCRVHMLNHILGGEEPTNERWVNAFQARCSDEIIKWGGDEFVIILPNADVEGYLARITTSMRANDVYGVFAVVHTSDKLRETVARAYRIAMHHKQEMEATGQTPHRDAPYICLDSVIIYEENYHAI